MFCCDAGSDELAVHSFVSRLTLRNLRAHCSTAALLRTISWQRIFKGLLEVTIVIAFSHMWLLTSYVLGRWCSETVNDDSARHVVLYCVERSTGESVAMLSLPQLLKLNYGVRQGRNQLFISGGGQFPWTFIRWRHRAYSTMVNFFANGHRYVLFATFPKMRIC